MKKFDKIPFEEIVAALLDNQKPFSAVYLHRFSDLEPKQVKVLREAWPKVETERRYNLICDLNELASVETVVMFSQAADVALDDAEERTRAEAIDLLTNLEDLTHGQHLIQMLKTDPSEGVREHAAIGLGFYVYMSEMEEIDPKLSEQVTVALLDTFKSKDSPAVRRRCLEALGYSSDPQVPILIEGAFHADKPEWIASALFAMGRSGMERWGDHIKEALEMDHPDILLEAVRAAGELSVTDARPTLLKMAALESTSNEALQYASIWALSQIGGDEVQEVFDEISKKAEEEEDEDMLEFIEEAQENLEFSQEVGANMDLWDMDPEEFTHDPRVIDLENMGDDLDEFEDEEEDEEEDHSPDNGKKKHKHH